MKKKLLVLASALCANYADAYFIISSPDGSMQFKISGSGAFSLNGTAPKLKYYTKGNTDGGTTAKFDESKKHPKDTSMPRAVAGEANIEFETSGSINEESRFGCCIVLNTHSGDTGTDKMYIFLTSKKYGELNMGNVKGFDQRNIKNGQGIYCAGAGGLDGIVSHDIPFAVGLNSPLYPSGYSNKATKITYTTPKLCMQKVYAIFAMSYTPDTKHVGHADKDGGVGRSSCGNDNGVYYMEHDPKTRPSGRDNVGLGVVVGWDFSAVCGMKFGFNYVFEDTRQMELKRTVCEIENQKYNFTSGETQKVKLRNVKSWQVSLEFTYDKFSIAGGYINNGKSRMPVKEAYKANNSEQIVLGEFLSTVDGNAGSAWNIGTKYEFGKWTLAVVYHNMQRRVTKDQKAKGYAITFGVDYAVWQGFKLFGEIDFVHGKSCDFAKQQAAALLGNRRYPIERQNSWVFAIGGKVKI